jgi:hypothetical protein
MHRLNFVGGLESQNRITNLQKFKLLFELIINKYPDVQFLTSDELAKSI